MNPRPHPSGRGARRALQILGLAWLLTSVAGAAWANALDQLREKADAGDVAAQFDLAVRYATGRSGAPLSQKQAAVYYEKAALGGEKRAMLNLGMMYEVGRGVPKDDLEAIRWTLAAAENGNTRAMYQMALRFEVGHGVEPDLVLAHMWLVLSATAGSPAASFRIASVENRLTKEQVGVSRRLAKTWARTRREARERMRERMRDEEAAAAAEVDVETDAEVHNDLDAGSDSESSG